MTTLGVFLKKEQKYLIQYEKHLNKEGYMEVETPILQPIVGGASARPFTTHHNTLNIPLYLRIANELVFKKINCWRKKWGL